MTLVKRLLWTWLVFSLPWACADEVKVAVAANFMGPAQQLAALFASSSGHTVALSPGATGKLYAQIQHGAPYQVLLSADAATPERLEQEGWAVRGSRFTYAVGRLALWSKSPSLVDDKGEVLRKGQFAHLALADPRLAPYGAAAAQVLTRMNLLEALRPKWVQGENIAQAYQFVATENAALGFVALSQVYAQGRLLHGSAWVVPADWHSPLRQDAVLLKAGQEVAAAQAWLQFLRTEPARAVMRAYGYTHD